MANIRSCDTGRHHYTAMGTRLRCTKCGAVQIDLTAAQSKEDGAARVFRSRRPTLFTIALETSEDVPPRAPFSKPRHRRG